MKLPDQNIEIPFITLSNYLLQEDPLNGLRKKALDNFKVIGLPEKKSEAYKYTPIKRILEKNFDFSQAHTAESQWLKSDCHELFYEDKEANHLVFVNGSFNPEFSKIKSSTSDLTVKSINSQSLLETEGINNDFGKIASSKDAFALLNTLSFTEGLFIHSQKNIDNLPSYIYHFIDASHQSMVTPRVLIKADPGSKIRVYEKTFRKGDHHVFNNSLVESTCGRNAEIRWTKLQHYTPADFSIEGFYASQFKDSRVYTNTISFDGSLIRNNLYISQEEENCETHMHGLYQIGNHSHVDNNTAVDHKNPNSFSNELYKGIIDENAYAVFNGRIYVRPQAQKTNAFQSNNNILLSELATIHTKPQLEIWADDVKCSHGCTTGQLDEEAIFYLRSRGISKTKAKSLMLNAFAGETLTEITNELVRNEIESTILNKLGY